MPESYELTVERTFSAAHAIRIAGQLEPMHGHDWHVTVCLRAAELDSDGLVCDFHALQHALDQAIAPWHNRCLNDVEPFNAGLNPTAEHVACTIAQRVAQTLRIPPAGKIARGSAGVSLAHVRVTEAVGCAAVFRPGPAQQ